MVTDPRTANGSSRRKGNPLDERTFEIILSRYSEDLLPYGWRLKAQQLGVATGTIDLLYHDVRGLRHLVELKKGPATTAAVDQVLRYVQSFASDRTRCVPWVVAHRIPPEIARYAQSRGVHTLAITAEACKEALLTRGTDPRIRVDASAAECRSAYWREG